MEDQSGATGADTGVTETQSTGAEISNADVKSHPLFAKLTKQLSELQKADADRKSAEESAAKEAELKKAEEEGRYQDALKARDEELASIKSQHLSELLERDLKTELMKAGFMNDTFVRGAVADYHAMDGDDRLPAAEYAAKLAGDESNKLFLAGSERSVPAPPGKPPVTGKSNGMTVEQCRQFEQSSDPGERKQAREFLNAYYKEHRKFPY